MHLYKTNSGNIVKQGEKYFLLAETWELLVNRDHLHQYITDLIANSEELAPENFTQSFIHGIQAPIGNQELWAAGVTYLRSRDARIEESKVGGGADFYATVYDAQRPELFFKANGHRVSAHGQQVAIRKDSAWNVPEPELTLFINSNGNIQGYTIGNDMSSRSIEGENPLYLPQAKVYNKSAALGPCLYIPAEPISPETIIDISIRRSSHEVFTGTIQLNRMKRSFTELAEYLFHSCDFHDGCYLMTGTGIVPGDDFTLEVNDEVSITIEGIGTLSNYVTD